MTQPFREKVFYQSKVWPEINISYQVDHLLLQSETSLLTCSNALWRGGMSYARSFVNWKVPLTYRSNDPVQMMGDQIEKWGYPIDDTIGFQTAAKLTHASIHEESGDEFRILCCTTVGTSNAARAGKVQRTYSAYQCGTINTFLLLDGKLSASAMVNGLITAAEAKAAALQDLHIVDKLGQAATGTTSDALVIAVSQSNTYESTHLFAGTATTVGDAIGRLVYQSVYEATATQGED